MNIDKFFKPKSIAIIGASNNKEKVGRQVLDNIISGGYKGGIYPINLKSKKIAGYNAFNSINSIEVKKFKESLVIIAIPAKFVNQEVANCGKLGIKNIIIISAGFKELGDKGLEREDELIAIAKNYKLNILGPNCLGFINNYNNLNASFAETGIEKGSVALISQSGAIGSSVLDWLRRYDLGLSYFISLGNKAVLDENSFFDYLKKDKNTKAILLYLEDMDKGGEFMEKVSKFSFEKPVIVLKSGLTNKGREMAKSHTGALAGSAEIVSAGIRRSGAIMIEQIEELFFLLNILQSDSFYQKISSKINLITNAGGLGVLSADYIENNKLKLNKSEDILGDASPFDYEKALKDYLKEKNDDTLLILLTPQSETKPIEVAKAIIRQKKKNISKKILVSFLGGESVEDARELLISNKIPTFNYPEQAIKALSLLYTRQSNIKNLTPYKSDNYENLKSKISSDYIKLMKSFSDFGMDTIKTVLYKKNKKQTSFPAVLKAVGPDFIHKSDKGAVVLNLQNQKEVDKAANNIYEKNKKLFKKDNNNLVVQPQSESGLEIILGIKKDNSFGHILLIGLGGIYTEVIKKTELAVADLNKKQAKAFIKSLPFYSIIKGSRGNSYNIDKLAEAMVSLCSLVEKHQEIKELDINPLILKKDSALVVDGRVFTE